MRLTVTDDLRRSRLTVFFRLLLGIPHFIWWTLWTIAALLAAVANWFATLVAGRPPEALYRFLSAYVRYSTHLYAYMFLAANPYPGFTGDPGYPVDVELGERESQRRWVTGLRLFLLIPAALIATVFEGSGYAVLFVDEESSAAWSGGTLLAVAFFGWFVCVVLGRMPQGFRDLQAYGLRYLAQFAAYGLVLTDRYPNVDPAEPPASGPDHPVRLNVDDDLRRSRLTVFFRLLLALPHFVWIALWWVAAILAVIVAWIVALIIGRPPGGPASLSLRVRSLRVAPFGVCRAHGESLPRLHRRGRVVPGRPRSPAAGAAAPARHALPPVPGVPGARRLRRARRAPPRRRPPRLVRLAGARADAAIAA